MCVCVLADSLHGGEDVGEGREEAWLQGHHLAHQTLGDADHPREGRGGGGGWEGEED